MLTTLGRLHANKGALVVLLKSALGIAGAALALAGSGCSSVAGVQQTTIDFSILPRADGTFWGWTNITVQQDVNQSNGATLLSVTLDVANPPGTPDLSFLKTLDGVADAPNDAGPQTPVLSLDDFPKGEQAVVMNVLYHGDLRPFFTDGHTIRLEWTGTINPAFTAWPPDNAGFQLRGRIQIDVQ
jgi:hypothetical protein